MFFNGNAHPSSDGSVEPLPFKTLGTRRKRVTLTVVPTERVPAAFVSLSSLRMIVYLRSRAVPQPLAAGAPRGRGTSRDGRSALRDFVPRSEPMSGAV
jgi:hypothetical protein